MSIPAYNMQDLPENVFEGFSREALQYYPDIYNAPAPRAANPVNVAHPANAGIEADAFAQQNPSNAGVFHAYNYDNFEIAIATEEPVYNGSARYPRKPR